MRILEKFADKKACEWGFNMLYSQVGCAFSGGVAFVARPEPFGATPRKDPMPKRDAIEVEGTVVEALPDAKFRVALDGGDRVVLAYLSGKVKLNFVRIVPGDRVRLELSPYDLSQGRITWRNRT